MIASHRGFYFKVCTVLLGETCFYAVHLHADAFVKQVFIREYNA